MKKLFNAAATSGGKGNDYAKNNNNHSGFFRSPVFVSMIVIGILISGCQKEKTTETVVEEDMTTTSTQSQSNVVNDYAEISNQTAWELQQARAATAKYRNINNAIKDGYADIGVVVPNMGFHYMKSTLVDDKFDFRKPEILVYNRDHDGKTELVAVEYAVPIDFTPFVAPQGFTGSDDVWDRNTGFGLWLLHAWVWHYNPDGVFNPTNPNVHLH